MSIQRVLLVDDPEDLKFSKPFDESFTLDQFDGKLIPNHHYFVIGNDTWEKIKDNNHIGLRGDNSMGHIQKLEYLNMGNNIAVTALPSSEWIDWVKEKMKPMFLDPKFGHSRVPKLEKIIFVTSDDKVDEAFHRLEEWTESDYGLDYETSGLTHEKHFKVIGVGIATNKFSYYFDWRLLDMDKYLPRYKEFLDKYAERCWVKNVDFEQEATYRYLSKFYNFREMSALRVIEGIPSQNSGSLKYIARDELGVPSWDDEYDDLLDNTTGDHWFEYVEKHYPNHISEFWKFEKMGWNTSFTRIPTDIIGRYCSYDSYYTLMCYEVNKNKYSQLCWDVYTNNYLAKNRLTGIFIDENELDIQVRTSRTLYLMGTYYTVREYLKYLKSKCPEIPQEVKSDYFLSNNILHIHKPSWLGKAMLEPIRDESKPKFINVDRFNEIFGDDDLLQSLYDMLPHEWTLDQIGRKRKVTTHLQSWLAERQSSYDLDSLSHSLSIESKLHALLDNNFDGLSFDELYKLESVRFGDTEYPMLDAQDYILSIYRITSPEVFTEMETTLNNELTYNYEMMLTMLHLSSGSKEVEELTGISNYKEQYERLLGDEDLKEKLCNTDANSYIGKLSGVPDWFWNILSGEIRKYMGDEVKFYGLLDSLEVPDDPVIKYYKYEMMKNIFKKYGKIISTYIDSIMVRYNRLDHAPDKNLHSIRYFEGDKVDDLVLRSYPRFLSNSTFSKRWSSGYHTIPPSAQIKRIVSTPPGYLMSYFDIKLIGVIKSS